jgi:hypothetical protein
MDMITNTSPLIWASFGVGVFIALLFFKIIFADFDGFIECVRYWFQPNFMSALRGEWTEDRWGSLKLFIWVALSVGCGVLAYHQLPDCLPGFFG